MNPAVNYLISIGCVTISMVSGICNESILREISGEGISPVMLLLLRQSVYTIIALGIMLIKRKTGTKYLGLHIFRGVAFSLAAMSWARAITLDASAIPLYLVYYIALCIPIFNTILSRVLLNESPSRVVTYFFIASMLPIFMYIISGNFVQQIILLVFACLTYSLLDCVNAYINNPNPNRKSIMYKLVKHSGKESLSVNNFYNAFVINIVYLISVMTTKVGTQWVIIQNSQAIMLKILLMGVLSSIIFPLIMLALQFSNLSSIQPLKIGESLIAASAFDYKNIPTEVMVGLAMFCAGSSIGIIRRF